MWLRSDESRRRGAFWRRRPTGPCGHRMALSNIDLGDLDMQAKTVPVVSCVPVFLFCDFGHLQFYTFMDTALLICNCRVPRYTDRVFQLDLFVFARKAHEEPEGRIIPGASSPPHNKFTLGPSSTSSFNSVH